MHPLAAVCAAVAFVCLLVAIRRMGASWANVGWAAVAVALLMLVAFFTGTEVAP